MRHRVCGGPRCAGSDRLVSQRSLQKEGTIVVMDGNCGKTDEASFVL
jgi:hypothetical protein